MGKYTTCFYKGNLQRIYYEVFYFEDVYHEGTVHIRGSQYNNNNTPNQGLTLMVKFHWPTDPPAIYWPNQPTGRSVVGMIVQPA